MATEGPEAVASPATALADSRTADVDRAAAIERLEDLRARRRVRLVVPPVALGAVAGIAAVVIGAPIPVVLAVALLGAAVGAAASMTLAPSLAQEEWLAEMSLDRREQHEALARLQQAKRREEEL